jgi:transcriptional regulator with XRE-family HTH domain
LGTGNTLKKDPKEFEAPLKSLGSRIYKVRKAQNLSQNDFASKLSLSPRMLYKYEKGLVGPGYEFFFRIVNEFGINPDFLLFGKGPMYVSDYLDEDNVLQQWFGDYTPNEIERSLLEDFRISQLVRLNISAYYRGFKLKNRELIRQDIEESERLDETGIEKKEK